MPESQTIYKGTHFKVFFQTESRSYDSLGVDGLDLTKAYMPLT